MRDDIQALDVIVLMQNDQNLRQLMHLRFERNVIIPVIQNLDQRIFLTLETALDAHLTSRRDAHDHGTLRDIFILSTLDKRIEGNRVAALSWDQKRRCIGIADIGAQLMHVQGLAGRSLQ